MLFIYRERHATQSDQHLYIARRQDESRWISRSFREATKKQSSATTMISITWKTVSFIDKNRRCAGSTARRVAARWCLRRRYRNVNFALQGLLKGSSPRTRIFRASQTRFAGSNACVSPSTRRNKSRLCQKHAARRSAAECIGHALYRIRMLFNNPLTATESTVSVESGVCIRIACVHVGMCECVFPSYAYSLLRRDLNNDCVANRVYRQMRTQITK